MRSSPLMTITQLPFGWRGRVARITATGPIRARLVQRGIMPGVLLDKVKPTPDGRGWIVRLGSRELALTMREGEVVLLNVIGLPDDDDDDAPSARKPLPPA